MAYIDQTYLLKSVSAKLLERWTDDALAGEIDDDIVAEKCDEASGEIDLYLQSRYSTPLAAPPKIIKTFAVRIAVYMLAGRKGLAVERDPDKIIIDNYNNTIKTLRAIADGVIDMTAESEAAAPETSIEISSNQQFTREKLEGF
jgi:phage gp36-like protein